MKLNSFSHFLKKEMLHVVRRVLVRSSLPGNSSAGMTVKYTTDTNDNVGSKHTRLRNTADHNLPGLTQLQDVCSKIISSGITSPVQAVQQMKAGLGPSVALGRFVMLLDHPDLLTTIHQLQDSGYSLQQILEDPKLLNQAAPEAQTRQLDRTWLDRLADKLGTTGEELLHRAPAKMNAFHPRSEETYLEKVEVLLAAGASADDILDCLSILNRSLACLRRRAREVRELGLAEGGFPIKLLNQNERNYAGMVEYRKQTMAVLGRHADSWHCLADKLDSTPELVKQRFRPSELVPTIQKIDVLLGMGITRDDILLRPRLVTFSLANIHRAKRVIESHDMEMTARSLSYFLDKNSFPSKENKVSMMEALCVLLNCSMSDLRDNFQYMDKALTSTISTIEKSIRSLVSRDITLAEICACPTVLNFESEQIERAFEDEDILPLEQWNSNVRLLNALAYTLGRQEPVDCEDLDSREDLDPQSEVIMDEARVDLVESEICELEQICEEDFESREFEFSEEELLAESSWSPPVRFAHRGFSPVF